MEGTKKLNKNETSMDDVVEVIENVIHQLADNGFRAQMIEAVTNLKSALARNLEEKLNEIPEEDLL